MAQPLHARLHNSKKNERNTHKDLEECSDGWGSFFKKKKKELKTNTQSFRVVKYTYDTCFRLLEGSFAHAYVDIICV